MLQSNINVNFIVATSKWEDGNLEITAKIQETRREHQFKTTEKHKDVSNNFNERVKQNTA